MIIIFLCFVLKIFEKNNEKFFSGAIFFDNCLCFYSSLFFSGRIPPGEYLMIKSNIVPIKMSLR